MALRLAASKHLPFGVMALVCLSAACGGSKEPAALPSALSPVQGRLLAFPHADAEGLLGRAVTSEQGGGFRIAESRAPGCEVLVRRTQAQFSSRRESSIADLATVGVGYQQLLALQAKYGKQTQASLELQNSEILEADLRGPCTGTVITKIFVGRGKRRLFAASQTAGSAQVLGPVKLSPEVESKSDNLDEIVWTADEAYAFDVRDLGSTADEVLQIDVRLPSIVSEGEEIEVAFESARDAYLVVLYVDSEGKGEVLWPSNEEPAPKVPADRRVVLPSPAERAAGIRIRPTLAKPGIEAREQLFVYAFADRRDFDLAKPSAGTSAADGTKYADELVKKLAHVPASRWSRTVLGYTIQPTSQGGAK
jgi:hypothetical protein